MAARQVAHKTSPLGAESTSRERRFPRVARNTVQRSGRFGSKLTARDFMTSSVVTARPEDSVERAARLISELDCGALPVVDGSGRLIGIVTNGDITARLVARGLTIQHAQVSDCMTDKAFACSADNSIENCMLAMSWHQVRRIPIVDQDHRVIGIICKRDLARYLCEHMTGSGRLAIADLVWALA
jgi:CBS-domain-containing membrane protein